MMNSMHRYRGMTLVEMMVVVSLLTMLSYALLSVIATFYRYNAYTVAQAYQVDHARRGVELLVRDLREMTYADDGAFPLVESATTSVTFFSDIDRDDSVELVTYELSSTTLYKHVFDASGSPPVYSTTTPNLTYTVSEYVQNSIQGFNIFTYYDENGAILSATSSVTDVRYIDVNIIVNIDPIRDPGEFMLRSSAALRNL